MPRSHILPQMAFLWRKLQTFKKCQCWYSGDAVHWKTQTGLCCMNLNEQETTRKVLDRRPKTLTRASFWPNLIHLWKCLIKWINLGQTGVLSPFAGFLVARSKLKCEPTKKCAQQRRRHWCDGVSPHMPWARIRKTLPWYTNMRFLSRLC